MEPKKYLNISLFFKRHTLLFIFLIFFFVISTLTYKDFGTSFDEPGVYLWGKLFYNRVRGNDPALNKDFVIPRDKSDMAFYNSTYPAILHQINKSERMEVNHFLNLLFSSVIFIAIYRILLVTFQNPIYAILGPLLLFTAPRFMGEVPLNPKDIPFAIVFYLALALIYFTSHWETKKRILILGIFFGLAQSWRIIGYTLYPITVIYELIVLLRSNKKNILKQIGELFLEVFLIFIIGFLIHMTTLPYLGADPFHHFIDLLSLTKKFPWNSSTLFMGQQTSAQKLPLSYLPVWFGITTPLVILFLVASTVFLWKKINKLQLLFLTALLVNFGLFFILRPVVYDGVRHMVFLIPILVTIASINCIFLLKDNNKVIKYLVLVILGLHLLFIGFNYMKLHPYEYTYFNIFVNGVKGADKQYETEYWGTSSKELFNWMNHDENKQLFEGKKIGVYGSVAVMEYYNKDLNLNMTVSDYKKNKTYDYISCWYRWDGCEGVIGELIYQVKRDNVVFNSLYKTIK